MNNRPSMPAGFTGLLTITFIALKASGVIDWSWWWVLAPVWIYFLIMIVVGLAVLLFVEFMKELMGLGKDRRK